MFKIFFIIHKYIMNNITDSSDDEYDEEVLKQYVIDEIQHIGTLQDEQDNKYIIYKSNKAYTDITKKYENIYEKAEKEQNEQRLKLINIINEYYIKYNDLLNYTDNQTIKHNKYNSIVKLVNMLLD